MSNRERESGMTRARILNGVNLDRLSQLAQDVIAHPDMLSLPIQAHAEWQGGGRCLIRMSRPAGDMSLEPRHLATVADALPNPDAEGGTASSAELLLAAFTSDLATGFVRTASERGIRVESLEIEACGVLELGRQLGLREDPVSPLRDISMEVRAVASSSDEQLKELFREAQRTSLLLSVLGPDADLLLRLEASGGEQRDVGVVRR
jgi:hypothetical protein